VQQQRQVRVGVPAARQRGACPRGRARGRRRVPPAHRRRVLRAQRQAAPGARLRRAGRASGGPPCHADAHAHAQRAKRWPHSSP